MNRRILGGTLAFLWGLTCPISGFSAQSVPWDYEGQSYWGALENTSQQEPPFMYPYATCSLGQSQSPVNLGEETKIQRLNDLLVKYPVDAPDFYNNGYVIQVNVSETYAGGLRIGKELYPLIQYHFHAPSEHQIKGQSYPAELHYVHIRDDGKVAALGILIKEGRENAGLETILNNMPTTSPTHNAKSGVWLDPSSLLPKDKSRFYTYGGSLTTPPCIEGVSWYVLAEPVEASAVQIHRLKELYDNNNRFPQSLNGRAVSRSMIP